MPYVVQKSRPQSNFFPAIDHQRSTMAGTTRGRRRRWCCGRCTRGRPPWWRLVRHIRIHTHIHARKHTHEHSQHTLSHTHIGTVYILTHTLIQHQILLTHLLLRHALLPHSHTLMHPTITPPDSPDASRAAGSGPCGGGEQPPHGPAHRLHAGRFALGRAPHRVQSTCRVYMDMRVCVSS